MATISGAGQRREPRSGGKMLRSRPTMLPRTPYDRPRLHNSTQQNPNWISRHVFSPTRAIVSGATRVLSSVFGFESSSSSSSSSSDHDSISDDTVGTNDDQDVSLEHHIDILYTSDDYNDLRGFLSCSFTGHQRQPQSFAGKNETKRLIEQLLMQESFSREECDKLTNVIKSRIVDSPMIRGTGLERLNETPNRTGGSDVEIHDLCSAAVIEAKKWLEEKKSGSNSKSELHHGTSVLNSVTMTHRAEGEAGSTVDMAKTYMRTRPPGASPSMNNIEFRSPSPCGMPLFKEETPYSIGGKYSSSSKRKRNSPASGSWNIQEEIRKVRSKATEEMLRTLSSPKIDLSLFALEHKSTPDSLIAKNLGPAEENNPQNSKKSVDASVDLTTRPVSQITEDALNNDALPIPATLGCQENQGMEAVRNIEGKRDETLDVGPRLQSTVDIKTLSNSDVAVDVDHLKDSNGSILRFSSTREVTVQGSQLEDKNCLTIKEVAEIGGAASTANGFPSSGSSMSAELDKVQNDRAAINEEENAVGCGDDNAPGVAAEENCELLSEASIEVPVVNENDVVFDSQDSSSMQYEGWPQHLNTPNSKRSLGGKSSSDMEKRQGKKVSRYNRRGRGRVR